MIRAGLAALAATFALAAAGEAAAQIVSHRAAYTLTLAASREGSGIAAARGVMVFDWRQECQGWTLTQRMTFRLLDSQGQEIDNDVSFSSFEAADGLLFRFHLRNSVDGETNEELRGSARLGGPGAGGSAVFTQPEGDSVPLPPGTIFPSEHARLLIERAAAGERQVQRYVFDGATLDGALDTNAVVGNEIAPAAPAPAEGVDGSLLAGRSWRVRIAYFKIGDASTGAPEYEISMRMFQNGVGTDFLFEYGEFALRATLDRLEALPRPACD